MLLSIAMIVKNEEKNISRSLQALKGLDNKIEYEIIVVDTGSTDNTKEIAKKFTDKVYEHPWTGDFSEMRNISISYCTGKWIMILDADEVIESTDEIVEFFKGKESKVFNCMTLKSKNMLSENESEFTLMDLVRLFRNHKDFKYEGRVHEQPFLREPIGISKITFLHYGYSRTDYNVMQYKFERNLELLLKNLEEGNKSIYNYYQIAQTYGMHNEHSEALKYIKIAYDLIGSKRNDIKSYLYVDHLYASTELKLSNNDKVIELAENAIKINEDHLDFYVMLINAYMQKKQFKIADKYCDEYLKLHKKISEGYIVSDILVPCNTLCRKDEIIKNKIFCNYNVKGYKEIPKLFSKIKTERIKEELSEIYMYSLLKNDEYKKFKQYIQNIKFEDKNIQSIFNILERLKDESSLEEILSNINDALKFNDRIKCLIEVIYENNQEISFNENIELDIFYSWKAKYIMKLLNSDRFDINILKQLKSNDIMKYVSYLVSDYMCISKLCKYSEENFCICNLEKLNLLTIIEDILILNESINGQEYYELLDRARINKLNYVDLIYNKDIIGTENFTKIAGDNLLIWIEINEIVKEYKDDKLTVIRKLRALLNKYPQYKKIINDFLENINYKISDEMIEEKQKLLKISENFICNGMIDEALEIIDELNSMFRYEYEILNLRGIALYSKGKYNHALLDLAIANNLNIGNFECIYNMGCVCEVLGKLQEACKYYEEAYKLTEDEITKNEILSLIERCS